MNKNQKPLSISINTKTEGATGAKVENATTVAEVTNNENAPKVEAVTVPAVPSIEELQARAEKTSQLVERYRTIKEKKAELDSFVILHENEQANITITDVKGRRISTNNPKSIAQVIGIWKTDISEALVKAEQDVRESMNAQQATPDVLNKAA